MPTTPDDGTYDNIVREPLRCPKHGSILAEVSQYTSGEVYRVCRKCKKVVEFKIGFNKDLKREITATIL